MHIHTPGLSAAGILHCILGYRHGKCTHRVAATSICFCQLHGMPEALVPKQAFCGESQFPFPGSLGPYGVLAQVNPEALLPPNSVPSLTLSNFLT